MIENDSDIKLVKQENATFEEQLQGTLEILDWLEGRYKAFKFSADDLVVNLKLVNGKFDFSEIGSNNFYRARFSEFYAIFYLNFPSKHREQESTSFQNKKLIITEKIISTLNYKERVSLILRGMNPTWIPGDEFKFDSARYQITSHFIENGVNIFGENEIQHALENLVLLVDKNKKNDLNLVQYNGEIGHYLYKNQDILEHVVVISYSLMTSFESTKQLLEKFDGSQEIFKDTNTMSPVSRVEFFDLISNMISTYYHRQSFESKKSKELNSFVAYSLKRLFGMNVPSQQPLLAYKKDEVLYTYCFNEPNNDDSRFISYFSYSPSDLFSKNFNEETKYCDGKKFIIEKKWLKSERLSEPNSFSSIVNDTELFRVRVYVTLANEISPWYIRSFVAAAKMAGLKIKGNKVVNSKLHFSESLMNTDLLVYAGHVLTAFSLHIGSASNRSILFEGDLHGKKTEIEVVIPEHGPEEIISRNDLETYYRNRVLHREPHHPLFVFVTSCNSESNVLMWPAIHREALRNAPDLLTRKDLPYVIASDRSFGTDSTYEILSHIYYPLDVINLVAQGKEVGEINQYLLDREYSDLLGEAYKRSGPIGKGVISSYTYISEALKSMKEHFAKEDAKGQGHGTPKQRYQRYLENQAKSKFSPVYNFDEKHFDSTLSMGGVSLVIQDSDKKTIYRIEF
jgi:hypothetical protein